MKYLISGEILFDTESGRMTCEREDNFREEQKLTNMAARVLSVLLLNHGKLVERDYLLYEVWQQRGYTSSSSSLSQYISILRKVFLSMGLEKCIIAVPGKGFIFSADASVLVVQKGNSDSDERHTVDRELADGHSHTGMQVIYPESEKPAEYYLDAVFHDVDKRHEPVEFTFKSTKKEQARRFNSTNICLLWLILCMAIPCIFAGVNSYHRSASETSVRSFIVNSCDSLSDSKKNIQYSGAIRNLIYDIYPDIEKRCKTGKVNIFIYIQP